MEAPEINNNEIVKKICRDVINYLLINPNTSREKITTLKIKIGKKYNSDSVIKNATILDYATLEEKKIVNKILKRRTTRTISGVSVIAIMIFFFIQINYFSTLS